MFAAGGSERESVFVSDRNEDQKIKVGTGNLKLVYSGKNGKITTYINKRSMVCCYLFTQLQHGQF